MTNKKIMKLKDYTPSNFLIEHADLKFDFSDTITTVTNKMSFIKNEACTDNTNQLLTLNGIGFKLLSIKLNQEELNQELYKITDEHLTITNPPESFNLEITTELSPLKNTSYEGLYCSNNFFVTQNEAQGFRKISYFLDRPDVMPTFTTTLIADKEKYPTLLSNGNLKEQIDLENGKHSVTWNDPIKKPCYLFAVVAGNLGSITDNFTTISGDNVDLVIYCEKGKESRCHHAMDALKLSMKWDEEKYGREYDLESYMIVAADNFNAGAMENKGLNVFNSAYVLANTETATDQDYENILGIIAHEYFHNWTGNRITLRDWFQLSLKEGLTVFRDQEFSIDMTSPVKRLDDVNKLRVRQFAEDAGPTAHPVQPNEAISVDNFFTLTIYEKGAEVIRMIKTILDEQIGLDGFRKGMDLYFERFDQSAVTIEDFVKSFEDANNIDLTQFRLWYHQSGTPVVKVQTTYNEQNKKYEVNCTQSCPLPAKEASAKKPLYIPLKMAFLDPQGNSHNQKTLILDQAEKQFTFDNIPQKPTLSILRDFSAPVILDYDYNDDDLALLMAKDTNTFTQWEAGQQFFLKDVLQRLHTNKSVNNKLINAYSEIITNTELNKDDNLAFKSRLLSFPTESYISQFVEVIDVDAIHLQSNKTIAQIAQTNHRYLLNLYQDLNKECTDGHSQKEINLRSLKNTCLSILFHLENKDDLNHLSDLTYNQMVNAKNMTDSFTALSLLSSHSEDSQTKATNFFYKKWEHESLVMNKLLVCIATSSLPNTLENIKRYTKDKIFDVTNPNKVYSLFSAYANGNPTQFHKSNGEGYQFLGEKVLEIDPQNSHVGSYLATAFNKWKKFDDNRKELMNIQLQKISDNENLSKNTYEIISKNLL